MTTKNELNYIHDLHKILALRIQEKTLNVGIIENSDIPMQDFEQQPISEGLIQQKSRPCHKVAEPPLNLQPMYSDIHRMLYSTMKRKYQENADLINSAEGLRNIFTDYKYHSKYVTTG